MSAGQRAGRHATASASRSSEPLPAGRVRRRARPRRAARRSTSCASTPRLLMPGELPEQRVGGGPERPAWPRSGASQDTWSRRRPALARRAGAVVPARAHAAPPARAARALPAPPAGARRARGADRPGRHRPLQSMLFLKPPGKPGQGWHQDSFYIPTHPDTLCGAWIAIDECDELNGAMWFAEGLARGADLPAAASTPTASPTRRCCPASTASRGVSDPDDEPQRADPRRRPLRPGAASARAGRRRLLQRPHPAPVEGQLHDRPLPARVRRPLHERPLLHAVGPDHRARTRRPWRPT